MTELVTDVLKVEVPEEVTVDVLLEVIVEDVVMLVV